MGDHRLTAEGEVAIEIDPYRTAAGIKLKPSGAAQGDPGNAAIGDAVVHHTRSAVALPSREGGALAYCHTVVGQCGGGLGDRR